MTLTPDLAPGHPLRMDNTNALDDPALALAMALQACGRNMGIAPLQDAAALAFGSDLRDALARDGWRLTRDRPAGWTGPWKGDGE